MSENITFRRVQAGDVEAVQLLFELEAEHNGLSVDDSSPYHPANSAVAVVNATISKDDVNCGWLAFSGIEPVGIITTPQNLAGGVFVSSAFRGQGIAQYLIREQEKYMKEELGLPEIERPVRADNVASIRLHTEKLGYHFSEASLNLLNENPAPPDKTVLYLVKTL